MTRETLLVIFEKMSFLLGRMSITILNRKAYAFNQHPFFCFNTGNRDFLFSLYVWQPNLIFTDQSEISFHLCWNHRTLFFILMEKSIDRHDRPCLKEKKYLQLFSRETSISQSSELYYWQMVMVNNDPYNTIINVIYWSSSALENIF